MDVEHDGRSTYTVQIPSIGFIFTLKKGEHLTVYFTNQEYSGSLRGFCGDMDGSANNDFGMFANENDFGDSLVVPGEDER